MSAPSLRISEAAALLAISPDTMRRRAVARGIEVLFDGGVQTIRAVDVARLAAEEAAGSRLAELGGASAVSARNRLRGIVTRVVQDGVMAQVDVQCGAYRMVSLISREAVEELGLAEGSVVAATVKATNVGIEAL